VEELLVGKDVCIILDTDNIVGDLEDNLQKIYKMSREERMAVGGRAIDFVKENLTWEIIGKKINKHLAEL
jgi:glycosyltransferase involved in cell wall biosynthesis